MRGVPLPSREKAEQEKEGGYQQHGDHVHVGQKDGGTEQYDGQELEQKEDSKLYGTDHKMHPPAEPALPKRGLIAHDRHKELTDGRCN